MSISTSNALLRPDHCVHKIPTSCRLTATPTCCACQDRRGHSSSYQKYIDGVGFVPWGTRQERYCWPCREFWNTRIEISGMRPSDTKIPERPNIENFLSRWYDWQRGFRIIHHEDGREERQSLVGEPLSDTSPGYLPRSVEELRGGLRPGEKEIIDRGGQVEQPPDQAPRTSIEIDSEDEHLFDSSEDEDGEPRPSQATSQEQMTGTVEHGDLAELAGDVPPRASTTDTSRSQTVLPSDQALTAALDRRRDSELTRPLRIAREHYQRVTALRRELQRTRLRIEQVISGLRNSAIDVPDSQEALDQIDRLSSALSRFREARLEIPEMDNPEWQSPISTMFERAWQRHNQVQSDRLHAITASDLPPVRDAQGRVVWPGQQGPGNGTITQDPSGETQDVDSAAIQDRQVQDEEEETPFLGLDAPGRPAPIEDEEALKIDNPCNVCLQQLATIATFPCGHMVMCTWCADEVIPRHRAARNIPRDNTSKCPQCRRRVKYIYNVRIRAVEEAAAPPHRDNE